MKKRKNKSYKTYLMAQTSAGPEYFSEETRNAIIQECRARCNSYHMTVMMSHLNTLEIDVFVLLRQTVGHKVEIET